MSAIQTTTTSPVGVRYVVRNITDYLAWYNYSINVKVDGIVSNAQTHTTFDANGASLSGYVYVPLTSAGTHTIAVTFTDSKEQGTGQASVTYSPPPPPPYHGVPIIAQEPNAKYRRSLLGCDGCAYATLSYSTPSYRSLDQERSLTLVYSSALADPRGLVVLDATPNSQDLPQQTSIQLLDGSGAAITLADGRTEEFYSAGAGVNRVSAQFPAATLESNPTSVTAVVRNRWPGEVQESSLPVRVLSFSQQSSPWGAGWGVAGLQRIHLPAAGTGDAMIEDGAGHAVLFTNCGAYCWTAPGDEPSALTYNAASNRYERRYTDGTIVWFNTTSGTMDRIIDRLGNTTIYSYDGSARLAQVQDPVGKLTTVSWTTITGGKTLAVITTPGGRTSGVTVDAAGNLESIVDPDNVAALALTYDGQHRLLTSTDRTGAKTSYAYDAFGTLASITAPPVQTDDRGFASSVTSYTSREAALLPGAGLGTTTSPASRVFPDSAWLRVRTQRGDSVRILANGAGDATAIITRDPLGKLQSTSINYNDAGQVVLVASSSGAPVSYGWTGSQLTSVNAGGTSITYSYNSLGQPTLTKANGAVVQKNFYSNDSRSVLDSTTSGSGTVRYTYDALGRVLTARDGEGHQSSSAYQPAGGYQNLQSATQNGKTVQYAYDAYGRPSGVTDPASHTTTTAYDAVNRPTQVVTPDQTTSTFAYDDANRRYTFTDAKLQSYQSVLDALGAVTQRIDPRGLSDYLRYDSDGNLSSYTTRAGRNVSMQYDVMDRLTSISYDGAALTVSYDTAGKWVAYSNSEGIDTLFVDSDGRFAKQVTARGGKTFTVTATYDALGARQSLAVTGTGWSAEHDLNYGADSLGQPTYFSDFAARGTKRGYDRDHLPAADTIPTGSTASTRLVRTRSYTPSHLLQSEVYNYLPDTLNRAYGLDAAGRVNMILAGVYGWRSVRSATFDVMGRLTSYQDQQETSEDQTVCDNPRIPSTCSTQQVVSTTPVRSDSYSYDAVGNRTDRGAAVGTGNRLTSFDGYTLSYDDDGNLLSKTKSGFSQSFGWNSLGQLVSVTTNGTTATYEYDGLGRRVRKTVNGQATYYLYDGDNLIMQLDGNGQPVLEFSYYPGIDQPHAVKRSSDGAVFYYTTERPGHVTALVNTSNQTVNRYRYTPFGAALSTTEAVAQPFRFAGREYDSESGLYYYRARYYDPGMGRFVSEDPIGLGGGINQFVYAGNDPINFTDPSGLLIQCAVQWTRGTRIVTGSGLNASVSETPGYWTTVCYNDGVIAGTTGRSYPAISAASRGGSNSGTSARRLNPQAPEFQRHYCQYAVGVALMSLASDVGTVTGVAEGLNRLAAPLRTGSAAMRIFLANIAGGAVASPRAAARFWGAQAVTVFTGVAVKDQVGESYGLADWALSFVPGQSIPDFFEAHRACFR